MESSSTFIIVPCYNEAARLDRDAFQRFVARTDHQVRLLLVDDGSTDDTLTVLQALSREAGQSIQTLALPQNRGKAEAVRQGVLEALARGADVVGYWDADLATPLESILCFLRHLQANPQVDFVMGARVNLLGRRIERSHLRHMAGRVIATCISMALGVESYDTQCGAKTIRVTPRTQDLFDEPFETRWLFDVELLGRYLARIPYGSELGVYELPLHQWRDVAGSKVKPSDAFTSLWELGRLYRRHFRHLPRRRGDRRWYPERYR